MITCNVWLLDSPEMVLDYAIRGGKIIFITEDDDPRLNYIPNKLSAKILLPPYDVVDAELENQLDIAQIKYEQYLSCGEPADYISILMAAAIQGISIGLYFGPELRNMKFPLMFVEFLYKYKGLIVGYKEVQPAILDNYMPTILTELLGKEIIDIQRFLMQMPVSMDIPPIILPFLIAELRPLRKYIKNNDYNSYFKELIKDIHEKGEYLYSPIIEAQGGN